MHLADAVIQSDLHCIQVTVFYILSALALPGNRTHDLGVASTMLYHLSYRKAVNNAQLVLRGLSVPRKYPPPYYIHTSNLNHWYCAGWIHAFMLFTPNSDPIPPECHSRNWDPSDQATFCSNQFGHYPLTSGIFTHRTAAHWIVSLFQTKLKIT